jgi:hypothetical protein
LPEIHFNNATSLKAGARRANSRAHGRRDSSVIRFAPPGRRETQDP